MFPLPSATLKGTGNELGTKPSPQVENTTWEFMLSYWCLASLKMSAKATFTKTNDPDADRINSLAK